MLRTREELLESLRANFGERTDDAVIALLEDVTDTLDDLITRAADQTNWESRYNDLDAAWRKRYTDRFYGDGSGEAAADQGTEPEEKITYEDLFVVE